MPFEFHVNVLKRITLVTGFCVLIILCMSPKLTAAIIKESQVIKSTAKDGKFIITLGILLDQSTSKCLPVIKKKDNYPNWILNGLNDLNRSKIYWIKGFDPKYQRLEGKDYFSFNYDVKFLFFKFKDHIRNEIQHLTKTSSGNMTTTINAETSSAFLKKANMSISLSPEKDNKTFVFIKMTVIPSWLVYKLVPKKTVELAAYRRMKQVLLNFSNEVEKLSNKQ